MAKHGALPTPTLLPSLSCETNTSNHQGKISKYSLLGTQLKRIAAGGTSGGRAGMHHRLKPLEITYYCKKGRLTKKAPHPRLTQHLSLGWTRSRDADSPTLTPDYQQSKHWVASNCCPWPEGQGHAGRSLRARLEGEPEADSRRVTQTKPLWKPALTHWQCKGIWNWLCTEGNYREKTTKSRPSSSPVWI